MPRRREIAEDRKPVYVYLPWAQVKALKMRTIEHNTSLTEEIEQAVGRYLAEAEREREAARR